MKPKSVLNWFLKLSINLNSTIILFIWDTKLRCSSNNLKITSNIALLPYGSIDCELQYRILEKYLNRNTENNVAINYVKPIKTQLVFVDSDQREMLSYEDKLRYFQNVLGSSNFDLVRGVFDDYRRKCSVEELFEVSEVDPSLIKEIYLQIKNMREIVDSNSIFVMPDMAYTKSRSIKHFAKKQEKRVIIVNPYGEVRNISDYGPLDPDPSREELQFIQQQFGEDLDIRDAAHQYVTKRMKGELVQDLDAHRAFGQREVLTLLDYKGKKILFLHCIADSANVPLETSSNEDIVLNDYFLWTREMFRIISKNPDKWLIKIHPASKLYPKDADIINRLILMFKIPREIIVPEEVSTLQVLESKAPIFTHSGTVALESAAIGQRAVCVKGRFDDEIAFNVTSMHEIEQLAALTAPSLQNLLKNTSEQSVLAENWLFLWRLNYERGRIISVRSPIQPNMSARQYLLNSNRICIEFYRKVLSRKFYSQLSELLAPVFKD